MEACASAQSVTVFRWMARGKRLEIEGSWRERQGTMILSLLVGGMESVLSNGWMRDSNEPVRRMSSRGTERNVSGGVSISGMSPGWTGDNGG